MKQTFFHLQIFWGTTPQGGIKRKKLMKDLFREIFHEISQGCEIFHEISQGCEIFHIFQGLEYATRNQ